ncbi:uro-adherence factor A-like isoform X2 [Battus philenor]|uniref:uro-adherence factor A-like isoform X2 n=1 Tax=Battus philenor TaxID=42288 RepID=UPI0035CFD234
MSGKPYTMSEMKAIVDYLTEKKAYGDTKGRKMWMDFEKSKFTDRSWQSLKETFLKRILPDIHNPYYQLSVMQISSFRQGYDIELKHKNKLEIKSVNEESNTTADKPVKIEEPDTSNNKEVEKGSGEKTQNSMNIANHRSSAETIVLDTCYDTAEDVQRDLESPNQSKQNEEENSQDKSPAKSLRDFITYSEPLTPMLQEMNEDFVSDNENEGLDSETQLEIVEDGDKNKQTEDAVCNVTDAPIEISSEVDEGSNNVDIGLKSQNTNEHQHGDNSNIKTNHEKSEKIVQSSNQLLNTPPQEIINIDNEVQIVTQSANEDQNLKEIEPNIIDKNITKNSVENNEKQLNEQNYKGKIRTSEDTSTQNLSNTTTDTIIPNNQEALNTQGDTVKQNTTTAKNTVQVKTTRKRANSQEPNANQIKLKKKELTVSSKPVSVSDTDAATKGNKKLVLSTKQRGAADQKKNNQISEFSNSKNKEGNCQETKEKVVQTSTEMTNNKGKNNQNQQKDRNDEQINMDVENPCLKSVSLYDEQFTSMKFSESSDEVITSTNQNPQEEKTKEKKSSGDNEVVSLNSNSEPDSPQRKKIKPDASLSTVVRKSKKDKALANVFGFSSGAVANSRKRRVSYQNRSGRRQQRNKRSSESSEWTSETESELDLTPRARRGKSARKYIKPKPARIFSLEEDGAIFVMNGKKIYPIVKNGKMMKNYVVYTPERDSENEDESYWKLKYIEEKKLTAKLTKMLHKTNDDELQSIEEHATLDLTKPSPSKKPRQENNQIESTNEVKGNQAAVHPSTVAEIQSNPVVQEKTLKIKITKQNEELQLEGHWSQIHPVLNQVVQIFHKENEPQSLAASSVPLEPVMSSASRQTTPDVAIPIDPEVRDKVNKLETEIFKEIETLDKQEKRSPTTSLTSAEENNHFINKSPVKEREKKKTELSTVPPKEPKEENVEKVTSSAVESETSTTVTRQTRTPRKTLNENIVPKESKVINTRMKSRKSIQPAKELDDETNIKYKFPSPPPTTKKSNRKSDATKIQNEQKSKNIYAQNTAETFPPLDAISINSISSQGYQDSDYSPVQCIRKKKRNSNFFQYSKRRYQMQQFRRKRIKITRDEISDESSISGSNFAFNSFKTKNSTLNTDMYNSESYQLLMPNVKRSFKNLDKIEENPNNILLKPALHDSKTIPVNSKLSHAIKTKVSRNFETIDDSTSSSNNTLLAVSPVLSIVENISISQDVSLNGHDNLNVSPDQIMDNEFNITNVDVSMPLMQQHCGFTSIEQNITLPNSNKPVFTNSLLNQLVAVNIKDVSSMSESLNQKLHDLLLDSTKKLARRIERVDEEEIEMVVENNPVETTKKKSGKRSSTPLKRQSNKKSRIKMSNVNNFIEEHTETYSQGGRTSCPPLGHIPCAANDIQYKNGNTVTKLRKPKGRKSKDDIIKVKIIKPNTKSKKRKTNMEPKKDNIEAMYKLVDSGMHETISSLDGDFIQELENNVNLIHNHSETCIQAQECISDSVEYIQNHSESVITIDSTFDVSVPHEQQTYNGFDSTCLNNDNEKIHIGGVESNESLAVQSPKKGEGSPNSLITEDLSDHELVESSPRLPQSPLISEDEITNTNFPNKAISRVYCRSNLDQIFPNACAVPNLSVITEASNENDNKMTDTDSTKKLFSFSKYFKK